MSVSPHARTFTAIAALLLSSSAICQQRRLELARQWEPLDPRVRAVADLDGDGTREIVVASHSGRDLVALRSDGSQRGYSVVGRIAGKSSDRVSAVLAQDVNGDGRAELLVSWFGARIELFDGVTLRKLAQASASTVDSFAVGDVDGDGLRDLLVRRFTNIDIRDALTLQLRGSVSIPSGTDGNRIQVADVHGDGRPEIVVGDGNAYSITRTGSQFAVSNIWSTPRGPLRGFVATDIDDDGKAEVVTARYDGSVGIERISPAPGWQSIASFAINYGLAVEDLDGDSDLDALVVCGCGSTGLIALTLQGSELWRASGAYDGAFVGRGPGGLPELVAFSQPSLEVPGLLPLCNI